jgi:uncharacterized protein YbjT (DUF2867 family)
MMQLGIGKTATIFGASGFIGRYIVEKLARDGWTIRAAVRKPSEAAFLKPLGNVGQITPMQVPLTDPDTVFAVCHGSSLVINLVGVLTESGKATFDSIHHLGARTVAEAASNAGASRLIHFSSIGADTHASASYAASKGRGEAAVMKAFPQATIFRPSIVFGPEDDFFNRFASMSNLSPALPLIGGGDSLFQPVYVADLAEAVIAALSNKATAGKTFELGGPEQKSFKSLLSEMLRLIDRKRFLVPLPFPLARIIAAVAQFLPGKPITPDQVELLKNDNIVSEGAIGFKELGITPRPLGLVLPLYLDRFKSGSIKS